MEQDYAVVPVGKRYICDDCGQGECVVVQGPHNNFITRGQDIKVRHECTACKKVIYLDNKYPLVVYVPA